MNNFEIKRKVFKLVAESIDLAITTNWESDLTEDELKSIETELKIIQSEFRKISNLTENQYELYLELQEIKRKQREIQNSMKSDGVLRKNNDSEKNLIKLVDFISNGEI